MVEFLNLLLLGIGAGSTYALNSAGIIITYRSSGVVNFAQCAIGVVGAFIDYELTVVHGWPVVPALIVGVACSAVVGLLVYVIAIQPLKDASTLTKVISTLAVLLILEAVGQLVFGSSTSFSVKQILPLSAISLGGGVHFPENQLILVIIAIVLLGGLAVVYKRTRFGVATSAMAQNPLALQALGGKVGQLRSLNWLLAGALSGAAAILLVPIQGLNVGVATALIIPALAAAMAGNMSSFGLALAGGAVIGIAQSELAPYSNTVQGLPDAVPFVLIIIFLIIRGRGLPQRGHMVEKLPMVGTGILRKLPALLAVFIIVSLLLGLASQPWQYAVTNSLIESVLLLSVVVTTGYAGQLSLAQSSLAGIAALVAAQVIYHWGVPYFAAFVIAVCVAIPVGLLVGLPAVRTRGITLALVTLGLAVTVDSLVFNNNFLTNKGIGLDITHNGTAGISIFGFAITPLNHPNRYVVVVFIAFVILALGVVNLRRGRVGMRLLAIRNNERAAASLGYNSARIKLWAFAYGTFIAAVGGVLLAYQNETVLFTGYSTTSNIQVVAYSVVGGVGSVLGPLVGGTLQSGGVGTQILTLIDASWSKYITLIGGLLLLITVLGSANGVIEGNLEMARTLWKKFRGTHAREGASIAETVTHVPAHAANSGHGATPEPGTADDGAPPSPAPTTPVPATTTPATTLPAAAKVPAAAKAAPDGAATGDGSTQVPPKTLSVRDLSVAFGGIQAVTSVSLDVVPGQVLALIGPNGAGKTTVIDAVTGFVRSTGTVTLGDERIDGKSAHLRARAGLARSFQSLELFEDMTVLDNLRCGTDRHAWTPYLSDVIKPDRAPLSEADAEVLDVIGLSSISSASRPGELPYGHRRLLAVGRALVTRPSVLLLDEPCAGLDQGDRRRTSELIRFLVESWGIAVMLIEHDVDVVRGVADQVVALDFGRMIARGTAAEVLADPKVAAAYLGEADPEQEAAEAQRQEVPL